MNNEKCWLCGNTMTYRGVVNAKTLGKCHNWECQVCGEGVFEIAKYKLNCNCRICGGDYKYLKDEELEVLGMILFQCRKCGDKIAVPIDCKDLEKIK